MVRVPDNVDMSQLIENVSVNYNPGEQPEIGATLWGIVDHDAPYGPKFKRNNAENGGSPYEIHEASGDYREWSGHGKTWHAYRCVLLAGEGARSTPKPQSRHREQSIKPSVNGNDDRSNRIERQHSQEMALRALALLREEPNFGEDPQEEGGPTFQQLLKLWTDYFQKDIGATGGVEEETPKGDRPAPSAGGITDDMKSAVMDAYNGMVEAAGSNAETAKNKLRAFLNANNIGSFEEMTTAQARLVLDYLEDATQQEQIPF
jgi:hypothetical protein